jgi:uncharacterized membrane protein (DUF106 family)
MNLSDFENFFSTYKFKIENAYREENSKLKEKLKDKEESIFGDLNKILDKEFNIVGII